MRTRRVFYVLLLGMMAAKFGHAQTNVATTMGEFLLIEPSSRLSGMGNAGVGFACEPISAYYNPAALAVLPSFGVQFTHSLWLADIMYDYAIAKIPVDASSSAMVNVTSLRSGDIAVRTVDQPLGTGENYSVSDLAFGVGYALKVTDRVAIGVQVTYLQESIWHDQASAFAINLGTYYQLTQSGIAIGASLSNFGTNGTFSGRDLQVLYNPDPAVHGENSALPAAVSTDSYGLPVIFRVGVGVPIHLADAFDLELVTDAFHPNNNTESISVGGELTFSQIFSARIGYQNLFEKDSEVGLSAGIGVLVELSGSDVRFDFGWTQYGRLGDVQRMTLGLSF